MVYRTRKWVLNTLTLNCAIYLNYFPFLAPPELLATAPVVTCPVWAFSEEEAVEEPFEKLLPVALDDPAEDTERPPSPTLVVPAPVLLDELIRVWVVSKPCWWSEAPSVWMGTAEVLLSVFAGFTSIWGTGSTTDWELAPALSVTTPASFSESTLKQLNKLNGMNLIEEKLPIYGTLLFGRRTYRFSCDLGVFVLRGWNGRRKITNDGGSCRHRASISDWSWKPKYIMPMNFRWCDNSRC